MVDVIDNIETELSCKNCPSKIKKSFGWLQQNKEFTCPSCGTVNSFNFEEFRNQVINAKAGLGSLSNKKK